jgi:hypothetical protein
MTHHVRVPTVIVPSGWQACLGHASGVRSLFAAAGGQVVWAGCGERWRCSEGGVLEVEEVAKVRGVGVIIYLTAGKLPLPQIHTI